MKITHSLAQLGSSQPPGAKGSRRQARLDLPEQMSHHTLEPAQLVCPGCGQVRPELPLQEEFLRWQRSVEKRAANQAQGRPS